MGITLHSNGNFDRTSKYLNKLSDVSKLSRLDYFGQKGVEALRAATPVKTGATASSWSYKIERDSKGLSLAFYNSNINKGVPIAVILQYGHGTGTGGYVYGRDYINPALTPIFNQIAEMIGKELSQS